MAGSKGVGMHLYFGTLTGIAKYPSKGVVLIGTDTSCSTVCQPRSLTSSRFWPVWVMEGMWACSHLSCISLILRITEGWRILNPRCLLWGMDLQRPS